MFSRSILLKTFLFISILLMTTLASPAAVPANEATPSSVGSIHTYLMPDLSLKSVFSVPLAPQAGPNATPPKFKGACRCSCAINNCNTDADCGPGGFAWRHPAAARNRRKRNGSGIPGSPHARLSCLRSRQAAIRKSFQSLCSGGLIFRRRFVFKMSLALAAEVARESHSPACQRPAIPEGSCSSRESG